MRGIWVVAVCLAFLSGCGGGSGNLPSSEQIRAALESKYREGLEQRVENMVEWVGEQRAREAIESAEGTADPAQVRVTSFRAEDIRQLENGDVTAKAVYVLEKGANVNLELSERVTVTKLQDNWVVIKQEAL